MLTTFIFNFLVNLLAIRSGLKPSIDNLSSKIIDRQYMDQALTLPTGISWPSVTIKYNYVLHTFISVIMLGSKVYNNIYNYAQ